MANETEVAVIGGDMRQTFAADYLSQSGYRIRTYGLCDTPRHATSCTTPAEALAGAQIVLLPLPITRDQLQISGTDLSISQLLSCLTPGMTVFGGMPSKALAQKIEQCGVKMINYAEDEVFQIRNALPTAEGAVAIAMGELRRTLFDAHVLIVGYGRIGKILGDMLRSMGAHVSIAARKATDLALIRMHGCQPICIQTTENGSVLTIDRPFDVIFNTVPVRLIDDGVLCRLSPKTILIELASAPGGIDYDAANHLGLKTVIALSLPGKVAPITAGEIVGDQIIAYVEGRRNDL